MANMMSQASAMAAAGDIPTVQIYNAFTGRLRLSEKSLIGTGSASDPLNGAIGL
jgi:hypothetical protein